MNLEEYNADSLRRLIRDLQEENNELRRQLRKKNIPTAESHRVFDSFYYTYIPESL